MRKIWTHDTKFWNKKLGSQPLSSSHFLQGKTQRRKPWLVPKRVWVLELFKLILGPRESLKGIEQKDLVMARRDFLIYCLLFPFFSSKLWFLCFWFSCYCDDVGEREGQKLGERSRERWKEIEKERSEYKEKIQSWGGCFLTFGCVACQLSLVRTKTGEKWRIFNGRGSYPINSNGRLKKYLSKLLYSIFIYSKSAKMSSLMIFLTSMVRN